MDKKEYWKKSTEGIPVKKIQSQYSEQKELLFPRSCEICDVGGSTGVDSLYFMQKGHSVKLLDISDVGLQRATEKAREQGVEEKLETYQVDLSEASIPLDNNSVDVVYSRLATHYFTKEKTQAIVQELHRILKQGGRAYLAVKSPEDEVELAFLKETAAEIEDSVYDDKGQIKSRFRKEQWEEILTNAGVAHYEIKSYIEDLSGRGDKTKSGHMKLTLLEIVSEK